VIEVSGHDTFLWECKAAKQTTELQKWRVGLENPGARVVNVNANDLNLPKHGSNRGALDTGWGTESGNTN